ncbi:MAG TPA: SDR family oxidoreductase [Actinomycetota bacterium]|nr:SDR family oxidoreductase [Actinomycetota bacterium]
MPVGVVTGASRGLGLALTRALAARGWRLVVDARDGTALERALHGIEGRDGVTAIAGDVADPRHRREIAAAAARHGGVDLLVNNAGALGMPGRPPLERHPLDDLERVLRVNVVAPLGLVQELLPALRAARGMVVDVTSDAAAEAYAGWGVYGASKAALDRLTAVLAQEEPELRVYSFDPGDMRTAMHQEAFAGEDVSDRPAPESVVPALLALLDRRPPSGRYTSAEPVPAGEVAS